MNKFISSLLIISIYITGFAAYGHSDQFTVVYSHQFIPFSGLGTDNKEHGLLIDFIDEIIGKKIKIPIKHEVCPWSRCQHLVKTGKRDAMLTVATPERRSFTLISELPMFTSDFIIFTGKNNPYLEQIKTAKTLEQLKSINGLIFISIKESGWHNDHLKGVRNFSQVTDSTKILELLKHNHADVYIEQAALIRYQIKLLGMEDDIVEIPNIMDKTNWHLCIRKDSPYAQIMPEVDKIMIEMKKSGELKSLRKKIFDRYR